VFGGASEHWPALAARDSAHDRHNAQEKQDPMGALQPSERNLRARGGPAIEMAVQDEGLGNEKNKGEKQPKADHRVHPPEFSRPEPIPKVEPPCHVEAGQTNHDDGNPRLPNEAVFDRSECPELVPSQVAAAYCRQRYGCGHRDPANPHDDRQDMERARHDDVRHGHPRARDDRVSINSKLGKQEFHGAVIQRFECQLP